MATNFSGQSADGTADPVRRKGSDVKSGLVTYSKTGAGTCTLSVVDPFTGAALPGATVNIAADAQTGSFEFPLAAMNALKLSSTSGTVSVNASIDGA